jgi:dihydrolipoamide dehydrogenase
VVSEEASLECRAGSIILATGSSWIDLPGIEIDGEQIITSDHALGLGRIDGDMLVVGGGAVGCEFAEIYSALGSSVTIVEMLEQLVPGEDTELARRLEAALKRKGIRVLTRTRVAGIDRTGERLTVRLDGADSVETDRVLLGVGRKPNTEGLGLEDIGLELEGNAIKVDSGMRTNIPGIFAVGDVTGKFMLAHVALAQGIVAGQNASGMDSVMEYEAIPRCVYSDPEFAAVGLTESRARELGVDVSVHKVRLGQIGRALTMGETFGLAKVVYESGSGKVLGFHALGPHASELLAEVTLAIRSGLSVEDIAGTIHPHPTLSEIIWECADGALGDISRAT